MRIDQPLFDLGQSMLERKAQDDPYVLFLGQACGVAAGVPTIKEIALRTCEAMLQEPDDSKYRAVVEEYVDAERLQELRDGTDEPDDEVRMMAAFYHVLGMMPMLVRANLIPPMFRSVPVPRFYVNLARMIQDGFFYRILTANIDTLLEQAMEDVGMREGIDYDVISVLLGEGAAEDWRDGLRDVTVPCVIRLYGSAAEEDFAQFLAHPGEADAMLRPERYAIKSAMGPALIAVGYNFESHVLDKAFYAVRELWWVNSDVESCGRIEDMAYDAVRFIPIEGASPEEFFASLRGLLDYNQKASAWPQAPPEIMGESPFSPNERNPELLAEVARSQLSESRADLAQTRRRLASSSTPDLARQYDYERRQVMDLEATVRRLTWSQEEIRGALRGVAEIAGQAGLDDRAVQYLNGQADAVDHAYEQGEPNEFVVTAALESAIRVADSLGPNAVDRKLVDELRSMAHGGGMGVDYGDY